MIVTPSTPGGAVFAGTAAWYRRRFEGRNCRIGKSQVVHAVRLEPSWIGDHEVPAPTCRVGTAGWDLAVMEPSTADVSCRRCLRSRPDREVIGDQPGRPGQLSLDLGQISA